MRKSSRSGPSAIRRITVDEKFSSGLMRILVARLGKGVTAFTDEPKFWEEETEVMVTPKDYVRKLGIPPDEAEKYPWDKLYEGQTFLRGPFRMSHREAEGPAFFIYRGFENFQNIEPLIKDQVKKEYFSALERSVQS